MTPCDVGTHVLCCSPECECPCHTEEPTSDRRGYGRRWADVRAEAVQKGLTR